MIIKKIVLHNIRSYEDAEIVFPEGSTILAGDIGSGKTSVLLAIEFALFGLQPGQKGSSLLRNGKNEGFVILEIEVDDKKIIVERSLKKGKTVNQGYSRIIIDNEEKETSVNELKNKILELLNYPKEFAKKTNLLYRFTVYTPQEEMKQIILETPDVRLDTLRHIFGIDKYKTIKENTNIFTIKLRGNIRNLEGQTKNLDEIRKKLEERKLALEVIERNILALKEEVKARKEGREIMELGIKEVEEKIKEKNKYEQEIEKTKIMLLGKKEMLARMEKEHLIMLKQVQEIGDITFKPEKIFEIEGKIKSKEREIDEKNKVYLELLSRVQTLNSKIHENEKSIEQISVLKLCPTCFQDVNADYKKNIVRKFQEDAEKCRKEILSLNSEKEKISSDTEKLKSEQENLKKERDDLKLLKIKLENAREKKDKIEEIEKQKFSISKDINLLEKQVETLKESFFLLKKYETIFQDKKKLLEDLLLREKRKELELASIEKEKELTIVSIEEINNEIKNKEKLKKILVETAELEDWLSNSFLALISFTERNIMLKLREDFSKLFNKWFNVLVPEIFSVRLDEDFTPIIEQQDFQLDYSFLSGGERTAIALAYRLSLNQIINSLLSRIKTKDIVILDEPTDGFSEQQLDKIRDVLGELNVKQLIIVSHETKIESFVENIIKFRKEAGVTKVEG